jgi:glycosyltransferase 2 family protein
MDRGRRQIVLTGAAAFCGLLLFAYAVRSAGVSEILVGVRRVGWGLLAIVVIAGLRFALRAQAWRLCMRRGVRLPFARAFSVFVAGDAVGNLTPLGRVASEPAKVLLTRHRLATAESITSLAVDNLIYAASAVTMIAFGVAVMLVSVPLPFEWREAAALSLVLLIAAALVAIRLMRGTWSAERGARPAWRERLAAVRESVRGSSAEHPARFRWAFALDLGFHALAVLEVFLVLGWLLSDRSPTLTQAVVFEALNRLVTIAFNFVPFRVGVDEALSGALAPVLTVDAATGVTLAVIRKARNLIWTGIGLLLIGAQRGQPAPAMDRPESASSHRP